MPTVESDDAAELRIRRAVVEGELAILLRWKRALHDDHLWQILAQGLTPPDRSSGALDNDIEECEKSLAALTDRLIAHFQRHPQAIVDRFK